MNLINSSKLYASLFPMLLTAAMPTVSQAQPSIQKRPNIIWISTEDFSPHLGCYGDKVAQTPHIDKLASQGVRFTNAFTTAAISAPCRAGIITGMYQTSIGCMHMRTTSYRATVENSVNLPLCLRITSKRLPNTSGYPVITAQIAIKQITSFQKILFLQVFGMIAAKQPITRTGLIRASRSLPCSII
jgi:hypothetical protein